MTQVLSEPEDLLSGIRRGDPKAEHLLVSRYWNHLKFVLERQNTDPQLVLDLCQETFIIVIEKARNNQIQSNQTLGAYIRSVGINLLIESKRKEKRRATYTTDTFDYLPDAHSSVEEKISKQQLVEMVFAVIDEFTIARDRDILKWTYLEHRSKADICQCLDISSAHYDRVTFRAKQRLKADLESKLGINLTKHTLSDYILAVFICLFSQANLTNLDNFYLALGDSDNAYHCMPENDVSSFNVSPGHKGEV